MLRTVRTVIVDEIHAVIGTRRGAHLALSLERLQARRRAAAAAPRPVGDAEADRRGRAVPRRPADDRRPRLRDRRRGPPPRDGSRRRDAAVAARGGDVARGLGGVLRPADGADPRARTTLVFVNTRRMAERLARHLSDRLGEDAVTAHHGSLSKEKRLDAETRLKSGTAQGARRDRVARARHRHRPRRSRLPDRIAASHRDAPAARRPIRPHGRRHAEGAACSRSRATISIECAALLRSIRRGELDAIVAHDAPLDVLAQQVVAESACREYGEDELFALVRRAWPYRDLARARLRRRRRGWPPRASPRGAAGAARSSTATRSTGPLRGRRGARLLAHDLGRRDSRSGRLPRRARAGRHVHRHAQRGLRDREHGGRRLSARERVVARAAGRRAAPCASPTPRARRRTCRSGSARRRREATSCRARSAICARRTLRSRRSARSPRRPVAAEPASPAVPRLSRLAGCAETGISHGAAEQVVAYLAEGRARARRHPDAADARPRALLRRVGRHAARAARAVRQPHQQGVGPGAAQALLPSVQLRAAGGGHRGRAAAVARPAALVPARRRLPLSASGDRRATCSCRRFSTRRCSRRGGAGTRPMSLAVPRNRGGRKVPPQLQRMLADDLMAAVFPDAAACLENIPGDRADSRSSAGRPDRARLPAGGDGLRRPDRGARPHPPRRGARSSRATRRSRRSSRTRS